MYKCEVGSFCCPPSYGYGPIIRDTHILHFIVRGKGKLVFHNHEYAISSKQIFVVPAGKVSYYEADRNEPWEYLQDYRMQKARQLLMEGQQAIRDIAYSVGYNDPFAFSKTFKRLNGVSPSAYRNTSG